MKNQENKKLENYSKQSVLENFAKCAERIGRIPDRQELAENTTYERWDDETKSYQPYPITRNVIENYYSSITKLTQKAMEAFPDKFKNVVEDKVYIPKQMKKFSEILPTKKGVLAVSVNADASIHKKAVAAALNYCKVNDLAFAVIPTNGDVDKVPKEILDNEDIFVVFEDIRINNAVCLSAMKIDPKSVNPLASSARLVRQNNSSMVFGSPKFAMESVPCEPDRHPDVMIATGSISLPDYHSEKSDKLVRRNQFADYDHMFSGVIIETNGKNGFFWRNVEFEALSGDLMDLGFRYTAAGTIHFDAPQYQVYGDLHSYAKDRKAFGAALNLAKKLEIQEAIMHDIMDNFVISHHKMHRQAEKVAMTVAGDNNYGKEISVLVEDLNTLTETHSRRVRIVPSNHDDMDSRALEDGSFLKETNNSIFGTMLFPYQVAFDLKANGHKNPAKVLSTYMHISEEVLKVRYPGIENGIAPLQAAVEMNGPKSKNKIVWHFRNDSLKAGRTELLQHGDKGSNGAKFSVATARVALGSSVTGHSHSPKALGHNMVVGCLCAKKQSYNSGGFTSWQHSIAHVYRNGSKQMITIVEGEYTKINLNKLFKLAQKPVKKVA